MAATGVLNPRENIEGLVDRKQLRETQELWHVNTEERPPMDDIFNGEKIIDREFDPGLMNTIGHELNHLMVAYKLGVPMGGTTLTAVPKGDILGQVTLPDHTDYKTLQIIATAGSVPTHDGSAHGYGSDMYKAQLIELFGMGTSVADARRTAQSLINFYSSDVRKLCAKIIAYLQIEKNMSYIPGDMLSQIEQRARYELKKKKVRVKPERFFKEPTPEEKLVQNKKEDTPGRPPDKRTIMEIVSDTLIRVKYLTDDVVENTLTICRVCKGLNGHMQNCELLRKNYQPGLKDIESTKIIIERYKPSQDVSILKDLPLLDITDQKYRN